MSETFAGTLVDVLERIGVEQIFGLIGDSPNSIADAVRHSKIQWIGVRHEVGAALRNHPQAVARAVSAASPFLWILLGIFGGLETFGLIALFLGPAIMSVLIAMWREGAV